MDAYICDKCKKAFELKNKVTLTCRSNMGISIDGLYKLDLCPGCVKKLKKFMGIKVEEKCDD